MYGVLNFKIDFNLTSKYVRPGLNVAFYMRRIKYLFQSTRMNTFG